MRYEDLRGFIAQQINADAALAALGGALVWNPFDDPNAVKKTLADLTRATGVLIEIGFPRIRKIETLQNGTTNAEAYLDVYIAEHPMVTHTPYLEQLVKSVIVAVTKRSNPAQSPVRAAEEPISIYEGGYILHSIGFYAPVLIK